ncbi:MAG TPA: type II secretion system F family protein [Opitutaceae bacterium]|nr:type II secretion system F family protein [Opitutaceae bacterium]
MAKLSVRTPPPPQAATVSRKPAGRAAAALAAGSGTERRKKRPRSFGSPINQKGLSVFTRQLATLVKAGMPIMRSLEVLARQEKRPAFKAVIENCADAIRSGGNFSDGLAESPKAFDRLYVNMVKAGEAGGVLDTVLERLSVFMEKAVKIRGKIVSAMVYPAIISLVAGTIMGVLMVWVVPKFQEVFFTMLKGKPLPALTQFVVGIADAIRKNLLGVIAALTVVFVLGWLFKRSRFGTKVLHWLLLHAPVVGDLFLKASIARFTRTFGTLLSSGVPILQALIITRDTSGNVHIANAINVVHDRVKEGDNVAKPLESTHIFPGMVTSMIEVGEETGALPDMLVRIADNYDEEVDNAVAALTSVIEPIMIVLMAVGVGIIVIAMFLPMVELIKSLSA